MRNASNQLLASILGERIGIRRRRPWAGSKALVVDPNDALLADKSVIPSRLSASGSSGGKRYFPTGSYPTHLSQTFALGEQYRGKNLGERRYFELSVGRNRPSNLPDRIFRR